jgi:hypothetical protein
MLEGVLSNLIAKPKANRIVDMPEFPCDDARYVSVWKLRNPKVDRVHFTYFRLTCWAKPSPDTHRPSVRFEELAKCHLSLVRWWK